MSGDAARGRRSAPRAARAGAAGSPGSVRPPGRAGRPSPTGSPGPVRPLGPAGPPDEAAAARPPRAAEWLLRRALPPGAFGDAAVGDLAEAWFARRARPLWAAAWYWREALGVAAHFGAHRVAGAAATTPLRRRPADAAVGVALLGAALLVAALVVGAADALLLRPVRGAERPRALLTSDGVVSVRAFRQLRAAAPAGAEVAAYGARSLALAVGGRAAPTTAVLVSGNYFAALGGTAVAHGRPLGDADDRPGAPLAAVVSAELFDRLLDGDTTRLGATVRVGAAGVPARIVGVARRTLRAPDAAGAELWLPIAAWPRVRPAWAAALDLDAPGWGWLTLLVRPAPGHGRDETWAALAGALSRLARDQALRSGVPGRLALRAPAPAGALPGVGWPLALGAAAAVALAAASVAHGRRVGRGAGRARLDSAVDAVVLAAPSGALALAGVAALRAAAPAALALDPAAMGGAVATLAAVAALGAAWPGARTSAGRPRASAGAGAGSHSGALAGTQPGSRLGPRVLAASLALVATAALLTAARAARAPAPWSAPAAAAREDGVHVASVDLGLLGYTAPDAESFLNRASARLRAAPALRAFAWATADPSTPGDHESFAIDGRPVRGAYVSPRLVSDGYFGAMRVHLVRGRAARAGAAEAVIDGEAARFWGGADPIGSRLTILDATVTVVGVVDETASAGTVAARPRVYARLDPPFGHGTVGGALLRPLTLLVVPSGDPGAALDAARAAVEGAAPRATLVWGGALADRLARGGDVRRATIAWSTALAALTGLAAVAVAAGDGTRRSRRRGVRRPAVAPEAVRAR